METKICKKCGMDRPLERFRANSGNRQCKNCESASTTRNKNVKYKHQLPYQVGSEFFKVCSKCKTAKPATEFYKASHTKIGLISTCKDCGYYKKHPKSLLVFSDPMSCITCGVVKPLKSFVKSILRKNGTYNYSRTCINCYKNTTPKNVPYFDESKNETVKKCFACKEVKILKEFRIQGGTPRYCKPCWNKSQGKVKQRRRDSGKIAAYCSNRYRTNAEIRKKKSIYTKTVVRQKYHSLSPEEKSKLFAKTEKYRTARRARIKNSDFVIAFSKADIIKRDGLNCYLCGKLLTEKTATMEHLIPISRQGSHKPENVKIACKPCNCQKNNKTLTEYKKWRGDYDGLKKRLIKPLLLFRLFPEPPAG